MKVGDVFKSVGGWDVQIIWICCNDLGKGFYAIHKPNTEKESSPIYHWGDGTAHSILSVNEPPRYGSKNPADVEIK